MLPNSTTVDDAFKFMYEKFMSEEGRERLLQKWNNLKFCNFVSVDGDKHKALRDLCSMAASIQLKLGDAYQDDQHPPDVLLNICRTEKWAHRLATMHMSRLLDVEESLARAISAEEIFNMPKPS